MIRSLNVLAAGVLAALAAAAPAAADTFVVTKRGDPPPVACTKRDCSLREAVLAANQNFGSRDTILLPNRRKPYLLAQQGTGEDGALTGDLDIANDPLVIKHRGKGRATIDARGIGRVFEVFLGAPTTFRKLVITGGRATDLDSGGGIRSEARIRVLGSRIAGNSTTRRGGGIELADDAALQLVGSTIAANSADLSGGGIDTNDSWIDLRRSRIVRNRATTSGGGIFDDSAFKEGLRIVKSTIAGNRSVFDGGGIYLSGPAPLRIASSTISGNRSERGGGLFATVAKPRLVNSTVAANRSDGNGGGIYGAGSSTRISLNAVTVARNVADADDSGPLPIGGGLYRSNAEAFDVENSLIALNRLGSGQRNDCGGQAFGSLGRNLLSTRGPVAMSVACMGFERPTDRVRSNPRIGKLRRYGGPTRTIALRKRSTAINRASRRTAPNRDQRGERRGRKKDIGAYERNTGG
jgi:CSLREA domain-containing protein